MTNADRTEAVTATIEGVLLPCMLQLQHQAPDRKRTTRFSGVTLQADLNDYIFSFLDLLDQDRLRCTVSCYPCSFR